MNIKEHRMFRSFNRVELVAVLTQTKSLNQGKSQRFSLLPSKREVLKSVSFSITPQKALLKGNFYRFQLSVNHLKIGDFYMFHLGYLVSFSYFVLFYSILFYFSTVNL